EPLVDRPGRFHFADGGASNTKDFSSVTLALQGSHPFGLKGLKYQFSYTHEGVSSIETQAPEDGVSLGGSYEWSVSSEVKERPFVEYAHFSNFGGQSRLDRDYAILGWATTFGDWELDLSGGLRHSRDGVARTDVWDHQANISLVYAITEHLHSGIGYNHIRV